MGRKFDVGDVVRVKETARKGVIVWNRWWFRRKLWRGVVTEYFPLTRWPYQVRPRTRQGRPGAKFCHFRARELDLVERPKAKQKGGK